MFLSDIGPMQWIFGQHYILMVTEVEITPVQILRISAFYKNTEGRTKSMRPIKLVLKDHDMQKLVFQNITKLKDASTQLKNLSIRYGLSQDRIIESPLPGRLCMTD